MSGEILAKRAECTDLSAKLEMESARRKDAEQKQLELTRTKADAVEKLKESVKANEDLIKKLKETDKAKTTAETEYEKAKTTGKQSFSKFEEQLNKAVEDLKKAVAERDEFKAKLEALKAAATTAPPPESVELLKAEVQSLSQKLAEKEAEQVRLDAELAGTNNTLEKIRAALAAPGEATPATQP